MEMVCAWEKLRICFCQFIYVRSINLLFQVCTIAYFYISTFKLLMIGHDSPVKKHLDHYLRGLWYKWCSKSMKKNSVSNIFWDSKLLSFLQSHLLTFPSFLIFSTHTKKTDFYSVFHLQVLKSHQVNFIKQKCAFETADR